MKCRHCGIPWEFEFEYCPQCHRNYGGAEYPETQSDGELRDIDLMIDQIHKAFAGVTLGGGDTIHQAHLEGIDGRGKRWVAAGEQDTETDWSEVPAWKLEQGASTLSFFDVEGWRFYLPAFMCWSLQNWRTTDSTTADSLIWSLTINEYHSVRYQSLNRAQSEVVYNFLEFVDRYSPESNADEAIRTFWHQFKVSI